MHFIQEFTKELSAIDRCVEKDLGAAAKLIIQECAHRGREVIEQKYLSGLRLPFSNLLFPGVKDILFVAHYDSFCGVTGSNDNALAVAALTSIMDKGYPTLFCAPEEPPYFAEGSFTFASKFPEYSKVAVIDCLGWGPWFRYERGPSFLGVGSTSNPVDCFHMSDATSFKNTESVSLITDTACFTSWGSDIYHTNADCCDNILWDSFYKQWEEMCKLL